MSPSSQSSSTQSAVIQQTAPWAAYAAGQFGVQAAESAAAQAQKGTNDAINAINTQYQAASTALRPTTQAGVQAQDALNQYIGLQPYMPLAPTAPIYQTAATEMKNVDPQIVKQYIRENTNPIAGKASDGPEKGQIAVYNQYTGVGSEDPANIARYAGPSNPDPGSITWGSNSNMGIGQMSGRVFQNDPGIKAAATNYEAEQLARSDNATYDTRLQQYNIDAANYEQDKGWAQQYATPLTSQQITDKITNLPGYQAQLHQGTGAINADAAAKGYLGSGAMLKSLMNFGQNTMSQFYGNTLAQLSQIAGAGANASGQLAQTATSNGNALAGLLSNLGNTKANAALSAGNAQSQALISANQVFSTMQTGSSSSSSGGGVDLGGIGSLVGSFL